MKWFLRGVITLTALFLIILAVLFSNTGNKLVWKLVQQNLSSLGGELVSGHLGKGWVFQNLSWRDHTINFSSEQLAVRWKPLQLIYGRVLLTDIDVKTPSIELLPSSENKDISSETSGNDTGLSIPVDIYAENITITDFHFSQAGGMKISASHFQSALQLENNRLGIDETSLKNLAIDPEVDTVSDPNAKSAPTASAKAPEYIVLPTVSLPLPINLTKLALTDTRYGEHQVPYIALSLSGQNHDLSIHSLDISHPALDADLQGKISLIHDYPLTLNLHTTLKQPLLEGDLEGQEVSVGLSGTASQLNLNIQATGALAATVEGRVEPLHPDIPFKLELGWQPFQWPLIGNKPDIEIEQGQLLVDGNLKKYELKFNTTALIPQQPSIAIDLDGSGSINDFTIEQAAIKTSEGSADIMGTLNWQNGLDWSGKIHLANANPAYWVPDLPGRISGHIQSAFTLTEQNWQLSIPELKLGGELRQQPIHISGAVKGDNQLHWTIEKLFLSSGENILSAQGSLAEQWNLTANIKGKKLDQLYPGLTGSVTGTVDITGTSLHPCVQYQLKIPSITWQNISLAGLSSTGTVSKNDEFEGLIKLTLDKLHSDGVAIEQVGLEAGGKESDHYLSFTSQGTPASTTLALTGRWRNNLWQGRLNKVLINTITGPWKLAQPVQLSLGQSTNKEHQLSLTKQHWQSGNSQLFLEPATLSASVGKASFRLEQFSTSQLKPFFPENFSWQAELEGQGEVQWNQGKPELSLQISTSPGTLEAGEIKSQYESLNIQAEIKEQNLLSTLHFDSQQLGQAELNLTVHDIQDTQHLGGTLKINSLMLSILAPFLPEVSEIKGTLSAQGQLDGSLQSPLFYGNLSLTEGGVATKEDIVTITDLTTRLTVNGNSGIISGQMDIGEGRLELGGNIHWDTLPPRGQITLKGNELDIQYPGIGKLKLKPDISIHLGEVQRITGSLSIPWARIKIKELPPHAVAQSSDVKIIKAEKQAPEETAAPSFLDIQIKVLIGDNVSLDAFGLQTHLAGGLGISQPPGKPMEIHGNIQLKEGRYRSFGQNLLIREGKIVFSGPPDNPYLIVEAIRNPDAIEDDVTVGIKLTGPVSRPDWHLFSDPEMPQSDQFSYLLRGRAMKSGSEDDAALQSMLLGLGISQIGDVVSSLGEAVGLQDVTLDTEGSGEETQVTVSGYLAPNIQVQYGIPVFGSIGEVRIRYELLPRLYLQAISGLTQALDIFYRFSL